MDQSAHTLPKGRETRLDASNISAPNADTIVVMDQGWIVEQGDHQEQMDRRDLHFDLHESQIAEPLEVAG